MHPAVRISTHLHITCSCSFYMAMFLLNAHHYKLLHSAHPEQLHWNTKHGKNMTGNLMILKIQNIYTNGGICD